MSGKNGHDIGPPIHKEDVLARIGGDEGFLAELMELYRAEFEDKRALLREAVGRKDAETVFRTAHSLKGASANLSLPGLTQACLALESAGRENDLRRAPELLDRIESEYRRLGDYLNRQPGRG
jgi:HPt (histidine-containing phosphotransfer) domain-containing protein